MKLEEQVTSLELSKKLKELRMKQESLFYWSNYGKDYKYDDLAMPEESLHTAKNKKGWEFRLIDNYDYEFIKTQDLYAPPWECYSAFTVAELGEILSKNGILHTRHSRLNKIVEWQKAGGGEIYKFNSDTEADARAKMLVYLLENKLIKV